MVRVRVAAAAAALALASPLGAAAQTADVQVAALGTAAPQLANNSHRVVALIDISDQSMRVYIQNELAYVWPVSTGVENGTPTGQWNAYWLSPNHRSSLYGYAPMPWAVFYSGNYAVHGTTAVDNLGRPASHGCVRLHPDNAKIFFELVETHGLHRSLVAVVD